MVQAAQFLGLCPLRHGTRAGQLRAQLVSVSCLEAQAPGRAGPCGALSAGPGAGLWGAGCRAPGRRAVGGAGVRVQEPTAWASPPVTAGLLIRFLYLLWLLSSLRLESRVSPDQAANCPSYLSRCCPRPPGGRESQVQGFGALHSFCVQLPVPESPRGKVVAASRGSGAARGWSRTSSSGRRSPAGRQPGSATRPRRPGRSPSRSCPRTCRTTSASAPRALPAATRWSAAASRLARCSFILKGYRNDYTLRETWRSLFRLHNETGNVWTHLCGGSPPPQWGTSLHMAVQQASCVRLHGSTHSEHAAGFILFVALTVFTVFAVPAPLSQAGEALDWLQAHFPDVSWKLPAGAQALLPFSRLLAQSRLGACWRSTGHAAAPGCPADEASSQLACATAHNSQDLHHQSSAAGWPARRRAGPATVPVQGSSSRCLRTASRRLRAQGWAPRAAWLACRTRWPACCRAAAGAA